MMMLCTRCPRRRCVSLVAVSSLVMMALYLYSEVSSSDDTGFPSAEFAAHWNSSPYCREAMPRRIHLMYQTENIPTAYADYVRSWDRVYPGWELHFWTDSGIEQFLQRQYGQEMVRYLTDYMAHGVERADLARLLIVNHFGGIYADLDVMALRSAEPLLRNHSLVITEEPLPHAVFLYDRPSLMSNAILYSRACHRFWRFYFKRYPVYLQSGYAGFWQMHLRRSQRYRAVWATGPIPLDKLARQFVAEREPPLAELMVAPPVNFQPRFDSQAPTLVGLWRRCLPVVRAALSSLQRRYCPHFSLNNSESMLVREPGSVSYARHDYLHIGYEKEASRTVSVTELVPRAVRH